jgi:hypothetical protein
MDNDYIDNLNKLHDDMFKNSSTAQVCSGSQNMLPPSVNITVIENGAGKSLETFRESVEKFANSKILHT